jgi:hypothetical protein
MLRHQARILMEPYCENSGLSGVSKLKLRMQISESLWLALRCSLPSAVVYPGVDPEVSSPCSEEPVQSISHFVPYLPRGFATKISCIFGSQALVDCDAV